MTDDDSITTAQNGPDAAPERHPDFYSDRTLALELGGALPSFTIRFETCGTLNADRSNAILVCHALSGDHHVAGRHAPEDRKPGWWNSFVGAGRPLDTDRYFVIGTNCLGGCQGSTGPASRNPATGQPYGPDFPPLTMRDMVEAQWRLVRSLGIERLHAVIGGSMGAMQSLVWAIEHPDCVARAVALAGSARQGAQAIAFNEVGRRAIITDPAWRGGRYAADAPPASGLAVARMLGHITYLSAPGMERKFGRTRHAAGTTNPAGIEFAVESYLRHQGESFVKRFDANSYLCITKATDRFDLTEGGTRTLESVFAPVTARVRTIGFSSDWLYPPEQSREIARALQRAGKDADCVEIQTDTGHDAFLLPSPDLFDAIRGGIE